MKKILGVLALSTVLLGSTALSGGAAFAGQNDDLVARLNAAEQENAAMRRKNAEPAPVATAKPASIADRMADFFGAYAADMPVAYKARPPVEPGRFTIWGEGGAIWTGGDQVADYANLNDFTTVGFGNGAEATRPFGAAASISSLNGSLPSIFDLNPKVGWTAATGFDYKFANSPWHVSGQFRYGQSGTASGSAASSGTLDPTLLSLLNSNDIKTCFSPIAGGNFIPPDVGFISACGGSQSVGSSYKETHWLADLALGYDVVSGPSYVQVKGGLRIAEMVGSYARNESQTNFVNYSIPQTGFGNSTFSSLSINTTDSFTSRTNFIGTGPLIGLEGSARFLGAWSFDYKGDLAVLFGTQNEFNTDITRTTTSPAILGVITSQTMCCNLGNFSSGGSASASSNNSRFVTVLSPDIQAGVSYWFTPNIKMSLSYRIDALIAVKNQKSADADRLLLPQRYWHGPLVGITGTF